MEKITSLQNVLIKSAYALREAKERRAQGMTIIDGAREILRALDADCEIDKVFYVQGQHEDLLKQLAIRKIELIEVNDKVMAKLAYGERHEGVIALAKTPLLNLKDLKLSSQPLVVVLESLEKPGNLGAILRTADAVGVEAILICDPKTDLYNPNIIRASTGMIFHIPCVSASAEEIFAFLKLKKIKIAAAAPAGKKLYTQLDFRGSWGLVLGSEDKGLSDFWLLAADESLKVPMKGNADSLNVSITAAVILYEALRQSHPHTSRRCEGLRFMRLQVFLSHNGVCSRRDAMEVIQSGRVAINGRVVKEPSTPVEGHEEITVDGQRIGAKEYTCIMLNKPAGYTTTKDDVHAEKTVMDLLPSTLRHLAPVGRLDRDSEGLLLLTNDGNLAFELTHPKFHADKTYLVRVKGELTKAKQTKIEAGIVIEGKKTAPCRIMELKYNGTDTEFKITLNEGRKRQIRMMARAVGHYVIYLCRLSMGRLQLGSLPQGQWRILTKEEVGLLK